MHRLQSPIKKPIIFNLLASALLLLAFTTSLPGLSQTSLPETSIHTSIHTDEGCLTHYAAKLAKIKKHHLTREIGKGAIIASTTALFALAPVPAVNKLIGTPYEGFAWVYAFGGIAIPAVVGYGVGESLANNLDREATFLAVHNVIQDSFVSEQTLKDKYFEESFASEIKNLNFYRNRLNEPELTEEEIAKFRAEFPRDLREPGKLTAVDHLRAHLAAFAYSYDAIRLAVLDLNSDGSFCPAKKNGKIKLSTYETALKQIKARLAATAPASIPQGN